MAEVVAFLRVWLPSNESRFAFHPESRLLTFSKMNLNKGLLVNPPLYDGRDLFLSFMDVEGGTEIFPKMTISLPIKTRSQTQMSLAFSRTSDQLAKKLIELPESVGHQKKSGKYHRVLSHLVEKCFMLKEKDHGISKAKSSSKRMVLFRLASSLAWVHLTPRLSLSHPTRACSKRIERLRAGPGS